MNDQAILLNPLCKNLTLFHLIGLQITSLHTAITKIVPWLILTSLLVEEIERYCFLPSFLLFLPIALF